MASVFDRRKAVAEIKKLIPKDMVDDVDFSIEINVMECKYLLPDTNYTIDFNVVVDDVELLPFGFVAKGRTWRECIKEARSWFREMRRGPKARRKQ